jgi:hypothetical protein
MSFSTADILAEFVESAGAFVASQLEFDYQSFVAHCRAWNTPEERARGRARYAAGTSGHHSRRAKQKRAERARQRTRMQPTRDVLADMRAARRARRMM